MGKLRVGDPQECNENDPRIVPFSEDLPGHSMYQEEDFFGKGKLAAQILWNESWMRQQSFVLMMDSQ